MPPWLSWLEHSPCKRKVVSSNLTGGSIIIGVWCNGITPHFGCGNVGSIPATPAIVQTATWIELYVVFVDYGSRILKIQEVYNGSF
jgi:hypothetical protein